MLLLVTLVLVVASAVLLVLGYVRDALGFIYLSMVCAGVAVLALVVFTRLARSRAVAGAGAVTRRGDDGAGPVTAEQPAAGVAAPSPGAPRTDGAGSQPSAAIAVPGESPAAHGGEPWDEEGDWGEDVVFPIAGYDSLRVADIVPLLGSLTAAQLEDVRDREAAGKARTTVLDRVDDLLGRPRKTGAAKKAATIAKAGSQAGSAVGRSVAPTKVAAKKSAAGRAGAGGKGAAARKRTAAAASEEPAATRAAQAGAELEPADPDRRAQESLGPGGDAQGRGAL